MTTKNSLFLWAAIGLATAANADIYVTSASPNPFNYVVYTGQGGGTSSTTGGGYFNPGTFTNSSSCIQRNYWAWQVGSSAIYPLGGVWDQLWSEDTGFGSANPKSTVWRSKLLGSSNVLEITLSYQVTGVAANQGYETTTWTLKNLTGSDISLNWYSLGALMSTSNGLAGNQDDQATYANGLMTLTSVASGQPTIYYKSKGQPIFAYEIDKAASSSSDPLARSKFYGTASGALTNTVASGAGNYAAIYEYQLTVPANASISGQTILGFNYVPVDAVTVAGNVTLGNYGSPTGQQVTIELRAPGSTTPVETKTVTLDSSGNYSFTTTQQGTFDVTAKASHWLRSLNGSVVIGTAGVTGNNYTLTNGDIDGNNIVNINDYAQLSDAFNTTPSDAAWNANADLDGNGIVNINDYSVLSDNFNLVGAN